MTDKNEELSLSEAANRFLGSLPSEESNISQQAINQFVRWFGRERQLNSIAADEIAKYAQRMPSSVANYDKKLEAAKAFLVYCRKEEWLKKNLAVHIKIKKEKPSLKKKIEKKGISIPLTKAGYDLMAKELLELKNQKPSIIEEIRRAAEDKDFRENAPLHAARERLGHLEGRIQELEGTLKMANIIGEKAEVTHRISTGDSVVLVDKNSGETMRYTLVSSKEANVAAGKVSDASPIGKAIIGKKITDIIEIEAPSGKLVYQIEKVERN
ncbi:MAG: transcription elongation factor GreA [Dehalococcoidia bacterium]|nr:MAG: transcription elongation factor GreA [Dehalococcoidia bacterium]